MVRVPVRMICVESLLFKLNDACSLCVLSIYNAHLTDTLFELLCWPSRKRQHNRGVPGNQSWRLHIELEQFFDNLRNFWIFCERPKFLVRPLPVTYFRRQRRRGCIPCISRLETLAVTIWIVQNEGLVRDVYCSKANDVESWSFSAGFVHDFERLWLWLELAVATIPVLIWTEKSGGDGWIVIHLE